MKGGYKTMKLIENDVYDQIGQLATIEVSNTNNYSLMILYCKHVDYVFFLEMHYPKATTKEFCLSSSESKELFVIMNHFSHEDAEKILNKEFRKKFNYNTEYIIFDSTYFYLAESLMNTLVSEKVVSLQYLFKKKFGISLEMQFDENYLIRIGYCKSRDSSFLQLKSYDFTILFRYSLNSISNDIYKTLQASKGNNGIDSTENQDIQNYSCPSNGNIKITLK